MLKNRILRITALLSVFALLFGGIAVPASAEVTREDWYDISDDYGYSSPGISGDTLDINSLPEVYGPFPPHEESYIDAALSTGLSALKARSNYKKGIYGGWIFGKLGEKVAQWGDSLCDKGLRYIAKKFPVTRMIKGKVRTLDRFLVRMRGNLPNIGKKIGRIGGIGVDAYLAYKGFEDMWKSPNVGYDSPFLEFIGNSLRGASSTATVAYNASKSPWAVPMAIGFTALDTAFNSRLAVKYANDHKWNGKFFGGFVDFDNLIDWINYAGQGITDYFFGDDERAYIERNNKLLEDMQRECRGATFQGIGVGVYKPNIYLYPEDNTQFRLTFEYPDLLTTTDPIYDGSWSGEAHPGGWLDVNGKKHDYLFYESQTFSDYYQHSEGFMIAADSRAEQFKDILTAYGFNEHEISDFSEFWCEKLDAGCDYAMYPQLTAVIDDAMPINVLPKPDSYVRIWFAFEKNGSVQTQAVPQEFSRNGFTLIEWGGLFLMDN